MLQILDRILELLFAYGLPLVVLAWTFLVIFLCLLCLTSDEIGFIKLESIGFAIINFCICIWFFQWKGEMIVPAEGYSHVPAFIAFIIAFLALIIPGFLKRTFFIPYCILAIIYVGILFFGL